MEEQKRNPAAGLSESEQVQVRRQKLADLQAAGRDPFTLTKFPQDAYSADLKEEFKDLPNETDSGKKVALAGRLMSKRVMGKASFAHLRDDKGDIQLYVRRDELGDDAYAAFKKLDVGDIIGVKGEVFRTKTGELSVENVSVGTHVTIQMEGEDEVEEYDIVGRTEADPLNGKISDESPVGHALLEKAVGDTAEVLLPTGHTVNYKVLGITHSAN